jgi:hypothetical protein
MLTHIDHVAHPLKRLERYDLLEEIERHVPCLGVGERCHWGCPEPTDDGNQENPD